MFLLLIVSDIDTFSNTYSVFDYYFFYYMFILHNNY